jgi:protein ImuB
MHWLDLHCPQLPLEVFAGVADAGPTAVVETRGRREYLVACNPAARRAGLAPGLTLAAARVRVPALQGLTRDGDAERAALERLAAACFRFTDYVALEPPADVLLEIGGSRRLFGGLRALCAQVETELAGLGRTFWLGRAPVPAAARLLARAGGGHIERREALADTLAPMAWSTLAPDAVTAQRLEGWGVRCLGECFALPRSGVRQRLGPAFLDDLDRLRGTRSESPPRYAPPQRFAGVVPLPAEVTTLDLPLQALEHLLYECQAWLRARDQALQGFRVELHARSGVRTDVDVGLVTPGREAPHMLALARERLERIDGVGTLVAVGVRAQRAVAYRPTATDLWNDAGREPPEHLLERLRARLGRDAIHGLALAADHRPERAWRRAAPGDTPAQESAAPPGRPLWLLKRPGPLPLDDQRRPLCQGALERLDGPERIETGWWDGDAVERDYFIARNPKGSLLWIYRERRVPALWYLHGLFA